MLVLDTDQSIRIALPNKGRLSERSLELFERAGLKPAFRVDRALVTSLGDDFQAIFVRAEDVPSTSRTAPPTSASATARSPVWKPTSRWLTPPT